MQSCHHVSMHASCIMHHSSFIIHHASFIIQQLGSGRRNGTHPSHTPLARNAPFGKTCPIWQDTCLIWQGGPYRAHARQTTARSRSQASRIVPKLAHDILHIAVREKVREEVPRRRRGRHTADVNRCYTLVLGWSLLVGSFGAQLCRAGHNREVSLACTEIKPRSRRHAGISGDSHMSEFKRHAGISWDGKHDEGSGTRMHQLALQIRLVASNGSRRLGIREVDTASTWDRVKGYMGCGCLHAASTWTSAWRLAWGAQRHSCNQQSATSHRESAISHQPSAISHQPSAISHHPKFDCWL